MLRRRRPQAEDHRVLYQVLSWALDYPREELVDQYPLLLSALAEQPDSPAIDGVRSLVEHLAAGDLQDLQRAYVDTFDLSRKHALYLSYWTDGDTRRRGEVLAGFKAAYRSTGFLVDTHGELPDYLPMVLEYAACADPEAGAVLLQEYRAGIELLRIALQERQSPYGSAIVGLCRTLPGASPRDRAEVMAMVGMSGPRTESVGLEPYDPRLLPLQPVSATSTVSEAAR